MMQHVAEPPVQPTSEREVYLRGALTMIASSCCTPDELREWWVKEIGHAPASKPTWGKKPVPPGRARISYGLTPMDCHIIETACGKRIEELEAWSRAYDRLWA